MKYIDDDVKALMEQNSPKRLIISFLMACFYGAAALPAALKIRVVAEAIAARTVQSRDLMANQYGGIVDTVRITASAGVIIAWLVTFYIVWHAAEKAPDTKARLKKSAVWVFVALAVFGLMHLASVLI